MLEPAHLDSGRIGKNDTRNPRQRMDDRSIAGDGGGASAGPAAEGVGLNQVAEDEQMAREFRWLLKEEVRLDRVL